ncbi:predicted protein [Streptomyces albidoflavus]|nr:predicted protein [Streptomyces albidoflavus]
MVGVEHGAPAGGGAPGQQVDAGARVGVAEVGVAEPRHQVVQVGGAGRAGQQQGGGHRLELESGGEDHAGQAEPAGGRVEERRTPVHDVHRAVGGEEFEGEQVAGEGAGAVVVGSVQVGADRAAHRDPLRPRWHRHEPAQRQHQFGQPVQGDPGVAQDGAAGRVDGVHPVERGHVEDVAPGVAGGVPGGPAPAPGDGAPMPAVADGLGRLLVAARSQQARGGGGAAAPAGERNGGVDSHARDRIARISAVHAGTSRVSLGWSIH